MAEKYNDEQVPVSSQVETTDRGMFDFMKKKDDDHKAAAAAAAPPQDLTTMVTDFDHKAQVSEPKEEQKLEQVHEDNKHETLLEKFHKDDSSSSSSSDEEGDDEEKKKMKRKEKKGKKGLKEKLFNKDEDTSVPIEKPPHVEEVVYSEPSNPEDVEKKGFMEKIKDKLPGHKKPEEEHHSAPTTGVEKEGCMEKIKDKLPGQKKPEEEHHSAPTPTTPVVMAEPVVEGEGEDKKGFLEKIKHKIPGFGSKTVEEKKDHHEEK